MIRFVFFHSSTPPEYKNPLKPHKSKTLLKMFTTTFTSSPPFLPLRSASSPANKPPPSSAVRCCATFRKSLEEVYKVRVERSVSKERLEELGVDNWSTWKSGKCRVPWNWHVDQLVYIVSGEVRVLPDGAKSGERHMRFVAGDLVRYPKWMEADMYFDGPYEERYSFRAYGDDN
ncbi:hypothetical protein LUZ60_014200 [Juncus effusus]|nr:hypothetical protein LUZ60_014200 [Juncus effusus]